MLQVLLRARDAIAAYYDGELEADDELARAANNGECTPPQKISGAQFASTNVRCAVS